MSNLKQQLTILGATGSIGESTLSVVNVNTERYEVFALTANQNWQKLLKQCQTYQPQYAVLKDKDAAEKLAAELKHTDITVLTGNSGLEEVASHESVDIVMCAIVGAAGLQSTLAAARAGKKVLLANKEALVMSGALFMQEIRENKATLLPIDSEHNAIFQCLPEHEALSLISGTMTLKDMGIDKILLTGSGGPFRTTPLDELSSKTPNEACAHPNWSMGRKISVDSATMMNKGLEYIEAHWLFGCDEEQIEIIVHPQSVIHSMVQYRDGSVITQMGRPDMSTPIAHAMSFPERIESGVKSLDFEKCSQLTFEAADEQRFPALRLAREALAAGGTAATILNAANEIAVDAFLKEEIRFTAITSTIEEVLAKLPEIKADSIEAILEADSWARKTAQQILVRNL